MGSKNGASPGEQVTVTPVLKKQSNKLERPRFYQVVLLNDDYTPMDFVIEILVRFFSMEESQATSVMFDVHKRGKGVCGIYTRDLAETKVKQVNDYARHYEYPLMCQMEQL